MACVIGVPGLGTRFNALMTIQVPLEQPAQKPRRYECGMLEGCSCPDSVTSSKPSAFGAVAMGPQSSTSSGEYMQELTEMSMTCECIVKKIWFFAATAPFPDDIAAFHAFHFTAVSAPTMRGRGRAEASMLKTMRGGGGTSMLKSMPSSGGSGHSAPFDVTKLKENLCSSAEITHNDGVSSVASAARVSLGTRVRDVSRRSFAPGAVKRDPTQHITATIVLYYTVQGGVPSVEDVAASIDDIESVYASLRGGSGTRSAPAFGEFNVKPSATLPVPLSRSMFPS